MASQFFDDSYECDQDDEIALDLKGRKHVDRNGDEIYQLSGILTSHMTFQVPGQACADAFRTFISGLLDPGVITDEYSRVTPLAEVANDDLPSLQARLLQGSEHEGAPSRGLPPAVSFIGRDNSLYNQCGMIKAPPIPQRATASNDRLLVARHVASITDLLDAKHVVVLRAKSAKECQFQACRTPTTEQNHPHGVVTLEPFIHWGTLTPALDVLLCHGRMLSFRRNGEMCKDPLWTQAIRRFTPASPPTYCCECLDTLTDRRTMVLADAIRSRSCTFTAVNDKAPRFSYNWDIQLDEEGIRYDRGMRFVSRFSSDDEEEEDDLSSSEDDNMVVSGSSYRDIGRTRGRGYSRGFF
ncbi:hypothetical protein EK21DRAFT_75719 [Setomelanomma holmii]|uniref:Uncharacterized protein n=1 Tax=Setomelanomma holmii TaxID=210430 RepID=A0A9P4H2W7_9PLEO|nr:hypothetical protein EK21DRAFT_75719 [Setomelanomma holmii]